MTLHQKNWLCVGVIAVGIFLFLLASNALNARGALSVLAALVVFAGLLLHMKLVRCPHCGEWVGKHPGEYCKHCGKALHWNEK